MKGLFLQTAVIEYVQYVILKKKQSRNNNSTQVDNNFFLNKFYTIFTKNAVKIPGNVILPSCRSYKCNFT